MHASLGRWLERAGASMLHHASSTAGDIGSSPGFPLVLLWWGSVAVSVGAFLVVLQVTSPDACNDFP